MGQDSDVSAIAAHRPVSSTAEPDAKMPPPCITARPSVLEKMRFRALALRSGMSESALALVAIRSLLGPDAKTSETRGFCDVVDLASTSQDGSNQARVAPKAMSLAAIFLDLLNRPEMSYPG